MKEQGPQVVGPVAGVEDRSASTERFGLVGWLQSSLFRKALRAYLRNRAAVAGTVLLALIVAAVTIGPLLTPYDYRQQSLFNRLKPPSSQYLAGTDMLGRDVLTRTLWGGRYSLGVGVASVVFALAVGSALGLVAGYYGGRVDWVVTRVVDALLAFPLVLLGLMVIAALGSGVLNVILAIGFALAPRFARLARGVALTLREHEYVEAARALGAGDARILLYHLLPSAMGPLMIMGAVYTAQAIQAEAILSFLGVGVQPPTPTWGNIVRDGVQVLQVAPWVSVVGGLAVALTVIAINLVGDGLQDAFNPRLRGE